nr:phosphopantetheine-binding protein [uncultured Gellertiella sp.]
MTITIINAILEGITEIAEVPAGLELSASTEFERDLGFDSGNFIELFLLLEEQIPGFTLGSSRLAQEDFQSVENIARFIERRLASAEIAA